MHLSYLFGSQRAYALGDTGEQGHSIDDLGRYGTRTYVMYTELHI